MISAHLIGPHVDTNPGLGNQMFAMAAACALAWDNNDTVSFPIFSGQETYKDNIFKKAPFNIEGMPTKWEHTWKEPHFHYAKIPYKPNLYLDGYFQSEKYFTNQKEKIANLFYPDTFDECRLKASVNIFDKVVGSIHVRRTDYLSFPHIHPTLTLENYYEKAIEKISHKVDRWLICSDDIAWCKKTFSHIPNVTFSEGLSDYDDMWLMALCDHFIISNSTFSWWSAWLSKNPDKKVVYPLSWFGPSVNHEIKDLIPESWGGI